MNYKSITTVLMCLADPFCHVGLVCSSPPSRNHDSSDPHRQARLRKVELLSQPYASHIQLLIAT